MLRISSNRIYITRGDYSGSIPFGIKDSAGASYIIQAGDAIIFSVKKNITDATPLLRKDITSGSLVLLSEDTASLPFGDYLYDVKLIMAAHPDNPYTVIPPTLFSVESEVHSGA